MGNLLGFSRTLVRTPFSLVLQTFFLSRRVHCVVSMGSVVQTLRRTADVDLPSEAAIYRMGSWRGAKIPGKWERMGSYGEKKTDKETSHKGIWRSDAPEASQGQTRDVPGTPGTFGPDLCVNQY